MPLLETNIEGRLFMDAEGWKRVAVTCGATVLTGGLVGLVVFLGLLSHAEAAAMPPVVVATPFGTVPAPVDMRAYLDEAMGSKAPMDRGLPDGLMPFQKPAKDCNPREGEVAMRGGCWIGLATLKPPCGELAFRGPDNICYRPVRASTPTRP